MPTVWLWQGGGGSRYIFTFLVLSMVCSLQKFLPFLSQKVTYLFSFPPTVGTWMSSLRIFLTYKVWSKKGGGRHEFRRQVALVLLLLLVVYLCLPHSSLFSLYCIKSYSFSSRDFNGKSFYFFKKTVIFLVQVLLGSDSIYFWSSIYLNKWCFAKSIDALQLMMGLCLNKFNIIK